MKRRGSQSIEFALLLPVLMGLTSIVMDYGWYFYNQNQFSQVVKDAARSAATLDHEASGINPCQHITSKIHQNLNHLGLSSQNRIVLVQIIDQGELRLDVELSQGYIPLFGLIQSPGENKVKTIVRLEDQNWESC